jgi:hypothetical protein
VKRSIGWTEDCAGVRCAFGLRVHTLQLSATPSNRVQRVPAQYGTSQCRYIDKLGVGPILPLLHDIDAVAELQRLDVPVLVQRHAPVDGARARAQTPITHLQTSAHVCVCVCLRVRAIRAA